MSSLVLRPFRPADEPAALAAQAELAADDFTFLLGRYESGELVGRVSIRHELTCDDQNVGSARPIEFCGGVFERLTYTSDGVGAKRRYWIGVPGVGTSG